MEEKITFTDRNEFRSWLEANSLQSQGIWLVFSKSGPNKTISPQEALEEALCFGWIDGKIKKIDDTIYGKYFSPRGRKSPWSEKNRALFGELARKGLVQGSGYLAVERAKKNGIWGAMKEERDYSSLMQELHRIIESEDVEAGALYNKNPPSHKKRYAGFYFEAKSEEVREKRKKKIIEMLRGQRKGMLY